MDEQKIPQGPKLTQEEIDKLVKKLLKEKEEKNKNQKERRNKDDKNA